MTQNARLVLRAIYQTGLISGRGLEITTRLPSHQIVGALCELLATRYITCNDRYTKPSINSFRSTYFAALPSRREEADAILTDDLLSHD